jgi:hypothetical protein
MNGSSESVPLLSFNGCMTQRRALIFLLSVIATASFAVVLALYLTASGNVERFSLSPQQIQNRQAVYLIGEGGMPLSFFHDIPLRAGSSFNMYVEIGIGERAKLEVMKDLPLNPIMQDIKNGVPRFNPVYPFIYGAFPQTWEDPQHVFFNFSRLNTKDRIKIPFRRD